MNLLENKIVLLGAGNLATQLGRALQEKGFPIVQVYSRTQTAAETLSKHLQTTYTTSIQDINTEANLYVFAVKDAAFPDIQNAFPLVRGLCVHTAGSLSLDIFADRFERCGVMYPLQTFSKNRKISFQNIPIFIEANRLEDEDLLVEIARTLSCNVMRLSSEKRKSLHLAAVFACNFTNHFYAIASQLIEEQGLNRDLLLPLIQETALKIVDLHPCEAQTGPAVRYDENVLNRHLDMLNRQPHLQELYDLLSENIHRFSSQSLNRANK